MKEIYSDIRAYQMTTESGSIEVHIIDHNGSHYRPNLIIPNLLALRKLKEYCEKVLEQHNYPSSGASKP